MMFSKSEIIEGLQNLSSSGFAVGVDFDGLLPSWVHSTYPKEWQDHYVEQQMLPDDPTIAYGLMRNGWTTWSAIRCKSENHRVLNASSDFGMNEGNTISMILDGRRTIASFSGSAWTNAELRHAKTMVSALHFMHASIDPDPEIDGKMLDVLTLMSRDMRDGEIADRLGIKIETVRRRRLGASKIAGVKTAAGLISHAKDSGWV